MNEISDSNTMTPNIGKKLIYLTYDEISWKLDAMINRILKESFDSIVVIVRGGSFPGNHLSVRTGLPIYYLQYDRHAVPTRIQWIGESPPSGKILLVEDLAGAGKTLTSCKSFLEKNEYPGYKVKSLVVYKDTKSASTPDFIGFETTNPNETFVLPWEKVRFHPEFQTLCKGKERYDHTLEFTAWDIEIGLALKDYSECIPLDDYDVWISASNHSDLAPYLMNVLSLTESQNGRKTLFMRSASSKNLSDEQKALWKTEQIQKIGCSRYIEKNASQALIIASKLPYLEVLWWNDGNELLSIKSSSFL